MRKKLFLTFAVALAFFAGANAQEPWNMTLSATEGLPGNEVTRDDVSVMVYQSGLIKPTNPIKTLRFTVNGTRSNAGAFFALSELTVLAADMKSTISYTVTSNADHNTLSGGADGQGLPALNDGKYNNYFHSMWAESPAVDGPHYLELTFSNAISEFFLEWGARPGNPKDAPAVVVLTEGGVSVEPFKDGRSFELKDQVTTLDKLVKTQYLVMRSNAATTYTIYNRETGKPNVQDGVTQENLEGCGPRYMTMANTWTADEPTMDYVVQLLPASNGKYYVYYPNQGVYLAKSTLNEALNGNQVTTTLKKNAAEITITPDSDSNFEMSYVNAEGYTVYIGADPRPAQPAKILAEERRPALDEKGWCEGFSIKLAWGWSFFEADYQVPAWSGSFKIAAMYSKVASWQKDLGEAVDLSAVIANMLSAIQSNPSVDEATAKIEEFQTEIHNLFKTAIAAEVRANRTLRATYLQMASDVPMEGKCDMNAFNTFIDANICQEATRLNAMGTAPELFENAADVVAYFKNKQANIDAFLATEYKVFAIPFKVTTDLNYLGSVQQDAEGKNRIVWEQTFMLTEPTNGIRMTFLETYNGSAANNYKGYNLVVIAELEIKDKNGNKLDLTESLISSNSIETQEGNGNGPIAAMLDNDVKSYYHSIWSGAATMNPEGHVYLDIKFPEGVSLDQFTIKTTSRDTNGMGCSPKTVQFTKYGEVFNPAFDRPNTYNVAMAGQVTDPAEIKDGSLYLISGNLRVNKEYEAAKPNFYSGRQPFTSLEKYAVNDTCVYMIKKAADGKNWNIISLSHGKYWAEDGSLTIDRSKAANVKFAASNNMKNTLVIYSEVADEKVKAAWNWEHEEGLYAPISIDTAEVVVNRRVYMAWDGGLAERLCVSEQPGEFTYGKDVIYAHELKNDILKGDGYSAGDYLHFNKMNGEGEWNIYEVTMDSPYFVYLKGLLQNLNDLGWVLGDNPGCIKLDSSVKAKYEAAKAAAEVAVKNNETANAKAVTEELIAAFEAANGSPRVEFIEGAEYAITNAFEGFYNSNQKTRSLYAKNDAVIEWTNTPDNFDGNNRKFLWEFIKLTEENMGAYEIEVPKAELGKAYIIRNVKENAYMGACNDGNNPETSELPLVGIYQVAAWVTNNVSGDMFNITLSGTNNNLHANRHEGGAATEGNIMYYGSSVADKSVWRFELVNKTSSVEDILAEGDDVVSVEYYTPAGVAISAPAKGINIVIKHYANGVVKATKVLVK